MPIATKCTLTRLLAELATARRIGVLASVAVAACSAWAETELEPGGWRLQVVSTTNGEPNPEQDAEICLREDELKDLGSYFAPSLDDVEAECNKTQQPSSDPGKLDYRMQCSGSGFTVDIMTTVTIENAHHFTAAIRIDSRTEDESAVVIAEVDGRWTGACEDNQEDGGD